MSMYKPINISDARKLLKDKLELDMLSLPAGDRIKVEYPLKVEEYSLNDPRGVLLLVFKGSEYQKTDIENYIKQDRDIHIGVVIVVKKASSGMQPEDYVDFVRESLSGIEIQVNRQEKKTYPIKEELLKEESGEWWYGITIVVPTLNIEKIILDNQ